LISPFSAYAALSMTANGASGATLSQMTQMLGTSPEQLDQLNQLHAKWMKSLTSSSGVKLEIANAIYSDESTPFKQSFISLCQTKFGAEAHSEDFSKNETVSAINKWCRDKTHGKITRMLDKLEKTEKMVLLNAIYFNGKWDEKFDKSATKDDHFKGLSGENIAIKMMHQSLDTGYYKGPNFSAVSLEYEGHKQRMYVFLPNPDVKMDAFEAQFTPKNWKTWTWNFGQRYVTLSMPKFKIEYKSELKDTLMSLGMKNAFTQDADFTKMLAANAFISQVVQKTYMDVNEEGTEAAAVTEVGVATLGAATPPMPATFRVDRPFVVALVDVTTDQILFLGTVTNPTVTP
jgi:serpin B